MDFSTFWHEFTHPSADMIVALCAFVLSSVDLYLHILEYLRGRIKLRITQDQNEAAYSLSFIYYNQYDCAFLRLNIINRSSAPITISRFELLSSSGHVYRPAVDIVPTSDYSDSCALLLFDRSKETILEQYPLDSENLMDNLRLDSYDAKSGYLTFYGIPPIDKPVQTFTLITYVCGKRLRTKIHLTQLPSTLAPQHSAK